MRTYYVSSEDSTLIFKDTRKQDKRSGKIKYVHWFKSITQKFAQMIREITMVHNTTCTYLISTSNACEYYECNEKKRKN